MCAGPECEREAITAGLCIAHYQQHHRGSKLKPLRTDDNTTQLVIRLSPELKKATQKAADRQGVTLAQWWRNVASIALKGR